MFHIVFTASHEGRLKHLRDILDVLPQWEVSRLLLEKGEIRSSFDKLDLMTPLMVSCWNGHQEVVEYLMNKCPASVVFTSSGK